MTMKLEVGWKEKICQNGNVLFSQVIFLFIGWYERAHSETKVKPHPSEHYLPTSDKQWHKFIIWSISANSFKKCNLDKGSQTQNLLKAV